MSVEMKDLMMNLDESDEKGLEVPAVYPTPSMPVLCGLASSVVNNNMARIRRLVQMNPKVLVSDIDRPTTVHVGCHYNVLHVACTRDRHEVVAFVLNCVSSKSFLRKLARDIGEEELRALFTNVNDGYLNSPDKMFFETPLQFAAKYLDLRTLEILMRHPLIDLKKVDLCKRTDFIGSRYRRKEETDFEEKCAKAREIMDSVYIVPIWRNTWLNENVILGAPASIRQLGCSIPSAFFKDFPDFSLELYSKKCCPCVYPNTSVDIRHTISKESWAIKAFAGPTTLRKATDLYNRLKSMCGRRCVQSDLYARRCKLNYPVPDDCVENCAAAVSVGSMSPLSSPRRLFLSEGHSPCSSPNNSLNLGKNNSYHSPPDGKQLTDRPTTPRTPVTKFRLDNGLSSPVCSPAKKSVSIRRSDPLKGLERLCRKEAVCMGLEWMESWEFINFYGNIWTSECLFLLETKLLDMEISIKVFDFLDWVNSTSNKDVSPHRAGDTLEEEDNSDAESYTSARESVQSSATNYEDCMDHSVFFLGSTPTPDDFRLFHAIKLRSDLIDVDNYPMLFQWFNALESATENDRLDDAMQVEDLDKTLRNMSF